MLVKIVIYIDGKELSTVSGQLYEDNPRDGKTNRKIIETLEEEVGTQLEEALKEQLK